IESWCLGYAWHYLVGNMTEVGQAARAATAEGETLNAAPFGALFGEFTGIDANGGALTFSGFSALPFLIICFVINFILIFRGLSRGIEKFCLYAMPLLIVCAMVVLVRVLTLDHIDAGLGFMWNLKTEDKSFWDSLGNGR